MEIIGKLHKISRDDHYIYLKIGEKNIPLNREIGEALCLRGKIDTLIGKSIALLRTDIPDKPFVVRLIVK
jgi:hypothetical protein